MKFKIHPINNVKVEELILPEIRIENEQDTLNKLAN